MPERLPDESVSATCRQRGRMTREAAATFGVGGSKAAKKSPQPVRSARDAHGSERAQPAGRPLRLNGGLVWGC